MKKKIKKQIISILLVGSVVLSSVGCAQKNPARVNKQIYEENDMTEVMAEVGNKRIVPQKSETIYPTESNETSQLYDTVENTIDIYAINRSTNAIDSSKTWDNTLFYELEDINPKSDEDGKLKTYTLTERQFVDPTTGNHITLEIYRSSGTNAINKIVCIEEKGGQLLITDFYYLDSGQLNFAFERMDSIYTPTYASPDKVGYRYYFSDDTMVKWRKVEQPQQIVDYVVNEADKGTGQNFLYSNLTSNEQHEYNDKATSILNIAYNVYEAAEEEEDSDREQGNIDGYVHDAGGQPMADVSVDIYEEDLSSHVGTITTDDEGHYRTGISYNDKGYLLVFRLEGYVEVELYSVYVSRDNPSVTCESVCMIPADIDACEVTLNIYDEVEAKQDADLSVIGLKDTTVTVRAGVNHTSGDDLGCYTCDETGALVLQLDPGAYTLEINCERYVVFIRVIFVFEDSLIGIPMTTELKDRQMKIVLNWEGNSDLDACLFTPYEGNEGDMSYVNPDTPEDDYGNRLSKDSQDGNLSEVILIDDYTTGTYKYYVSDYQGCISGNEYGANLKMLYVVVMIYDANGLVARYAVPYADGIIWEVCWIQSGKVVPVQKMYNSTTGKNWWSKEKHSEPIRLDRIAGEKTGRIDSIQIQDMYGKYLTTRDGKVRGGATSVGTEEQFVPIRCSDGTYAFRSMSTRDFVKSSGKSYGGFISDDHKIQLKEYAGVRDTYYIQFLKVSGKQWLTIDENEKWKLVDEEDAMPFTFTYNYDTSNREILKSNQWYNLTGEGVGYYDIQKEIGLLESDEDHTAALRTCGYNIMTMAYGDRGKQLDINTVVIDNMQSAVGFKKLAGDKYEVLIAFQGTGGYGAGDPMDVLHDAASNKDNEIVDGCHQGYYKMARKLIDKADEVKGIYQDGTYVSLKDLMNGKDGYGNKVNVQFTLLGHSMGGAIAQCFAKILHEEKGIRTYQIRGRTFNSAVAVTDDDTSYIDWYNLCVNSDAVPNGKVIGSIVGKKGVPSGVHRIGQTIWLDDDEPDKDFGIEPIPEITGIRLNKHNIDKKLDELLRKTASQMIPVRSFTYSNTKRDAYQWYTTNDSVTVYEKPGVKSAKVKTISIGTCVIVIGLYYDEDKQLWYRINDGTWIRAKNLEQLQIDEESGIYEVKDQNVPVRIHFYKKAGRITVLSSGDRIQVIGSYTNQYGNIWYQVNVQGVEGWIYGGHLERVEESVPENSQTDSSQSYTTYKDAYLNILKSDEISIKKSEDYFYKTFGEDYAGDVIISDFTGDGAPDLLYIKADEPEGEYQDDFFTSVSAMIYSFDQGRLENLYQYPFIIRAGGGCDYVFYTKEDQKLYLYERASSENKMECTTYCLNEEIGQILDEVLLQKAIEDNNSHSSYFHQGKEISANEYDKKLDDYQKDSIVLIMNNSYQYNEDFAPFRNQKPKALTWQAACESLKNYSGDRTTDGDTEQVTSSNYTGKWSCLAEDGDTKAEMTITDNNQELEVDLRFIRLMTFSFTARKKENGTYGFATSDISGSIELKADQKLYLKLDESSKKIYSDYTASQFLGGNEFEFQRK